MGVQAWWNNGFPHHARLHSPCTPFLRLLYYLFPTYTPLASHILNLLLNIRVLTTLIHRSIHSHSGSHIPALQHQPICNPLLTSLPWHILDKIEQPIIVEVEAEGRPWRNRSHSPLSVGRLLMHGRVWLMAWFADFVAQTSNLNGRKPRWRQMNVRTQVPWNTRY